MEDQTQVGRQKQEVEYNNNYNNAVISNKQYVHIQIIHEFYLCFIPKYYNVIHINIKKIGINTMSKSKFSQLTH